MAYPKHIHDRAFDILAERRNRARALQQHRQQEIAQKVPQVAQIDRELSQTSLHIARTVLSGQDVEAKMERLRDQNLYMQQARIDALRTAGYPEDYLEMPYTCKACNDTGFTEAGMCDCMKTLLKELSYKQLGEAANVEQCRFDNFRLEYYPTTPMGGGRHSARDIMSEAYERCKNYARQFHKHAPSLFFQGPTGLGKTHLSLAIAGQVVEKGYDVLYTSVQTLMYKLEQQRFSRSGNDDNSGDYMQIVLDADLLILDDLGAEFITGYSVSALYNILNTRFLEERPTIVSSNLDIKTIEDKYSQRIVSRLLGCCTTIPFVGNDIRMLQK